MGRFGSRPSGVTSPHEVEGEFLTTPALVTHPPSVVEWRKASEMSRTQPTGGARLKICQKSVAALTSCWHGNMTCFETNCNTVEFGVELATGAGGWFEMTPLRAVLAQGQVM